MPTKVSASWGHATSCNIAGWDSRHDEEYVTMVLASLVSGDIEMLERSYPIIIHRYSLLEDSGGAGKCRGGSGTCWEVEPLDKPMTIVAFGEGRRIQAMGAAGAASAMIEPKVGRFDITRNGETHIIAKNVSASASLTSDKSYQIDSGVALNKASGGQAGSPFAKQEFTPKT